VVPAGRQPALVGQGRHHENAGKGGSVAVTGSGGGQSDGQCRTGVVGMAEPPQCFGGTNCPPFTYSGVRFAYLPAGFAGLFNMTPVNSIRLCAASGC
jgi:hypothetical protein